MCADDFRVFLLVFFSIVDSLFGLANKSSNSFELNAWLHVHEMRYNNNNDNDKKKQPTYLFMSGMMQRRKSYSRM